jgi:hypothetical protein
MPQIFMNTENFLQEILDYFLLTIHLDQFLTVNIASGDSVEGVPTCTFTSSWYTTTAKAVFTVARSEICDP